MPEPAPLRLGHSPVLPAFPAYRTGLLIPPSPLTHYAVKHIQLTLPTRQNSINLF